MTANKSPNRILVAQVDIAGETVTACGATRAQVLTTLSNGVKAHCERAAVTLPVPFAQLVSGGDVTLFDFSQRGGYISNLLDNTDDASVSDTHKPQ